MVASYRARFGLDQPLIAQYFEYWRSILRLDLGVSLAAYPERVSDAILGGLPWTLGLLGGATVVSFVIGSILGGLMGWPRTPRTVRWFGSGLVVLSAVPYFLVGMILLYVFAIVLRWFPAGGGLPFGLPVGLNWSTVSAIIWHATLPMLSIVIAEIGAWALGMRGMLVSVLGDDYIALATAKGLKPQRIFLRYGVRNALLPQFTKLALALGHIVSGAILVEVIFSYPGIGFRLYQAIQAKDYFVIQGIVLLLSVSIAVAMFILDLLYPLIDPRITHARKR
jgi:peptide/nickel transport system permease protein